MEISKHGWRVLNAIGEGRQFQRRTGEWVAGALRAPESLVGELERLALIAQAPGGALRLTGQGEARCRGRGAARRLLDERPLADPDPGRREVDMRCWPKRAARSVTVNMGESPLGWLRARGMICDRQYAAGERLRQDWTLAGLAPGVTMRWDPSRITGGRGCAAPGDATLAQISAKQRFDGAVAAAGGGLGDILWRVVCAGEGLAKAEEGLGWPKRAGKLVLAMALDRVAAFYGID